MSSLESVRMRELRDSDVESVAALIRRTIDARYTGVYPPRAVDFFKQFHAADKIRERSARGTILVVEQAGALVGTGALVDNEIYGLFVEPEVQGKGVGGALMRELESRAQAEGRVEIHLSVSLPSRQFYERLGYEILEEAQMDVGEGQELRYWKARKPLG
ncbi:MAG: GNAT family N-acetyltransferase [Candidatus Hydrogenedentes bacterium]|nr:GNAT family N-acetyltransferase [Candidatus Hydrogenedentota bacterium]